MNPGSNGGRRASVDALRGITVAAMLLVNNPGDWGHVYAPLQHAQWNGLTPADLIFPLFLFIVGVSAALALMPRLERGDAPDALAKGVLSRSLRIIGLGLLLHLCVWWAFDLAHFRPMGVLQRIGLCFAIAGLLVIRLRERWHWCALLALLAGYAGLLAAGGSYAPFDNLVSRIDHAVLGVQVYQLDPVSGRGHDPEGLASTLGALATTLLGVRAGVLLRRGNANALWLAGAVTLALGHCWSFILPLNKNLWTPSYVLWTGGVSFWLLALAHVLIDRWGLPAWGRAFGLNAIAAYAGSALLLCALVAFDWLAPVYQHGFADWITPRWGPYVASVTYALTFVAFWWVVVRWLYARKIYIKV